MSNNELNEIDVRGCTCYYFDVIANLNYLNLTNILFVEKSYDSFLIYDVAAKLQTVQSLYILFLIK